RFSRSLQYWFYVRFHACSSLCRPCSCCLVLGGSRSRMRFDPSHSAHESLPYRARLFLLRSDADAFFGFAPCFLSSSVLASLPAVRRRNTGSARGRDLKRGRHRQRCAH
ncbi:unnamed protein product, partial [Ectocarpus sp. 12 AP-2014]